MSSAKLQGAITKETNNTNTFNPHAVRNSISEQVPDLKLLDDQLSEFNAAHAEYPTFVLANTFLEMTGILISCIQAQCLGQRLDFLAEAGNLLPYIVAAGHDKYRTYLPLYRA